MHIVIIFSSIRYRRQGASGPRRRFLPLVRQGLPTSVEWDWALSYTEVET